MEDEIISVPVERARGGFPRRWWRRLFRVALVGLAGLLLLAIAGLRFSSSLLTVQQPEAHADAILVLGGDTTTRPQRALEVYQAGLAPRVLVSGDGDCDEVRVVLVGKGVPADRVETECESSTTRENALYCVARLRASGVRRAIIVTSWFHSRRALKCFQHYAPEIEFISLPTSSDLPRNAWPNKWQRKRLFLEYVKLGYYWVRFGVNPF